MQIRSIAIRAGNATVGAVLVTAGLSLVPLPGVAWYVFYDAFSNENRYMDDGPVLTGLVITLLGGVIYAAVLAPAIWRRRSFLFGPPETVSDDVRRKGGLVTSERKRRIVYVLAAAAVPVLSLLTGAAWTLGDHEAAARGVGTVPAICMLAAASLAYVLLAVPAIRKMRFDEPLVSRDPLEEAFAASVDHDAVLIRDPRHPLVTRYVTLGGVPGPFWESPAQIDAHQKPIITPYPVIEDDDPEVEVGPEVEMDLAQIERWERGEDDPPVFPDDAFAPTERAMLVAPIVSIEADDDVYDEEAWFS